MHSSELPVTEYWDPAWDVYDVPLSPWTGFGGPEVPAEVWWAAYEHVWILSWIRHGTEAYIPFHYQHQLTTGYDEAERLIDFTVSTMGQPLEPWQERLIRMYFAPEVVRCECWPLVTRLGEPPELEQNPDCRLHWEYCPLMPCSCEYGLHYTLWNPTHLIDVPGIGQRGAAFTFRIDPDCEWHGDDAEEVWGLAGQDDPPPPEEIAGCSGYLVVLDEAERHNR